MKTFFKILPFLIIPIILVFIVIVKYNHLDNRNIIISKIYKADKTVDHSKFEILQQEFESPQDLTVACLSCHNKRGEEFMKTSHWNFTSVDTLSNGKVVHLGKKNVINNFCVGINSNEMNLEEMKEAIKEEADKRFYRRSRVGIKDLSETLLRE